MSGRSGSPGNGRSPGGKTEPKIVKTESTVRTNNRTIQIGKRGLERNSSLVKQGMLCGYLVLAIWLIIFKYPLERLVEIAASWQKDVILEGLSTANFTLFKTIRMYIRYRDRLNSFENLVGNVVVFIPFGFLLPWAAPEFGRWWKVFFNAFLFVTGIEVFQLFSAFGAFDVDDILLNCAGAMLGYLVYFVWKKWADRRERKQ